MFRVTFSSSSSSSFSSLIALALAAAPFAVHAQTSTPAPAAQAAPAATADTPSVKVGIRVQTWFQATEAAAPDGGTAKDFQVRRAYAYLSGTLPHKVSFFAHLSGDRIGQQGLDTPALGVGTGFALRDGWIAWEPRPEFRVQVGRMYVPFTRSFGTESTFTQLGVDMPATQGGGRGALLYANKVARDDGAVVWGTVGGGRMQYRVGVMDGLEGAANPSDSLRVAGRVSLSLLEHETTWFNRGSYLGTKRVLAFGGGIDRQGDLVVGGRRFDTDAWTADVFFDQPVGKGAVTVEGAVTSVDGVTQSLAYAAVTPGSDATFSYVQAGILLPGAVGKGRVQLYGRFEQVDGDVDTKIPAVGATFLVRGHDLKTTVEWNRLSRTGVKASQSLIVQLQAGM